MLTTRGPHVSENERREKNGWLASKRSIPFFVFLIDVCVRFPFVCFFFFYKNYVKFENDICFYFFITEYI